MMVNGKNHGVLRGALFGAKKQTWSMASGNNTRLVQNVFGWSVIFGIVHGSRCVGWQMVVVRQVTSLPPARSAAEHFFLQDPKVVNDPAKCCLMVDTA